MSYKCDNCNKISKPGEPCSKIITGKKDVIYYNTILEEDGNRKIIPKKLDPKNLSLNQKILFIRETKGWEIIGEKNICLECKEILNEKV
jgi:hypothetical protein